jgi:hypothetical protein
MCGWLAAAGPPLQAPAPLGWLAADGALPHVPGLLGWLAADAVLPHVPGLLGWLAADGALLHGAAPRGLLGWLAAGVPEAGVALGPAGGTARKESVISQGGTPVFGRALPASGFAAACFAGPGSAGGAAPMLGGRP